jgi:hypothetical protein
MQYSHELASICILDARVVGPTAMIGSEAPTSRCREEQPGFAGRISVVGIGDERCAQPRC